ncbi:MAG: hypothetical protein OXE99_12675, partial [Cellvibrionales bacterium]|nr:hypothetical protein [Cellvibrionales bacterium]
MHLNTLLTDKKILWCIHDQANLMDISHHQVSILTNRYDQYLQSEAVGLPCTFSDFTFDALTSHQDLVVFALAKEKAINHHIIGSFFEKFPATCQLLITGEKNQGIKSLVKSIKATGASICEFKDKVEGKKTHFYLIDNNPSQPFISDLPDYHRLFT